MKKATVFLFWGFLILLPFDFRAGFLPGVWGEKVRLVDFLFILLQVSWLISKVFPKFSLRVPPQAAGTFGLLGASAISLFMTFWDERGWVQISAMFYMVCIYWITYDVLDTERLIRQTLVLWVGIHTLLSAAGLAGIGLYFLNVVTEVARIRPSLLQLIPFPRTEGFSAGPNAFILDVHWAMTAALIFWMEAKQKGGRALWVWAAFWILFFAMMGTVSRAILGSLVSLLLLLNQHHKAFRLTVWKQIVAGLLILITPIVLILTVWVITPFHLQNPILHSSHRLISDWNDAWSPYFLMAVVNIDMIKDHWLWGIGLGHFQHWLPVYSAAYPMDEYSIYETRSSFNTLNPMSFYLGWFVQTGLPGLAALAAFFIPFFLRLLRAKEGRLLALGFYAAMAGFFIQGLFTDYMFSRGFWLFLGLAAAVIKVPQEMNGASGRRETKLCR